MKPYKFETSPKLSSDNSVVTLKFDDCTDAEVAALSQLFTNGVMTPAAISRNLSPRQFILLRR